MTVTHLPLKLAPKFLKRLKKHAIFMMTKVPEDHFDMGHFFDMACDDNWSHEKERRTAGMATMNSRTSCGTSACSAGWAPVSLKIRNINGNSNWSEYIEDVFGLDCLDEAMDAADTYFFGGGWANRDNSPEGAGARILYVLEKGVPVDCFGDPVLNTNAYRDEAGDILPWIKEIAKQG